MRYLQSARSSARFHGEHEGPAEAAPPPWTGSLCERLGSPRCWRIEPEKEKGQIVWICFFPQVGVPKISRINTLAYGAFLWPCSARRGDFWSHTIKNEVSLKWASWLLEVFDIWISNSIRDISTEKLKTEHIFLRSVCMETAFMWCWLLPPFMSFLWWC